MIKLKKKQTRKTDELEQLAQKFLQERNLKQAEITCRKILRMQPNDFIAHTTLGCILKEEGFTQEALQCFQKSIQFNPGYAKAYYNLGLLYQEKNQIDEAVTYYRKALQIIPDWAETHWDLSHILLLSGDFGQGWKELEWRFRCKDYFNYSYYPQPVWNGCDIAGRTILLHAEQGFGDTIQFVRYAPLLALRGAKIILDCQKELASLLRTVTGIDHVIRYGEQLPKFDTICSLLTLPLIFETTLDNIPVKMPYVTVAPSLVQKWQHKVQEHNAQFRVGLVWAGKREHKNDRNRSCSPEIFWPLLKNANITFYTLQKGDAAVQIKNAPKERNLVDYTPEIADFADTAALIENLDLVITVDTSVAHLAGALGKPVWTLLPFVPDWRWLLNREDSPWYPTMRLFRQPSPGDWDSVITRIIKELKVYIDSLSITRLSAGQQ
jgi:Tfp pilus assembly protein PilF